VSDAAQARRRILEGWQFIAVLSEARPDAGQGGEIAKELGLGKGQAWPGIEQRRKTRRQRLATSLRRFAVSRCVDFAPL